MASKSANASSKRKAGRKKAAAPRARPRGTKTTAATSPAVTAGAVEGQLTVIDVGHGSSAVLIASGLVVVFDAGPGSSLLEFLRQSNITEVHEVFISHSDQDHIEGVLALLGENIRIRNVRLNTDSLKGTDLWDDLLFELHGRQLAGELMLHIGLTSSVPPFAFGSVTVSVLAPSGYLMGKGPGSKDEKGREITSNSVSAVLHVRASTGRGVLFTGDLDSIGLSDLERCKVTLDAAVLVYPHHGGRGGGDDRAFAKKLATLAQAEHVIFSIERHGRNTGNPRPDVVQGVRDALPTARIACTQLSTHCAATVPTKEPRHLLPIYARGRTAKVCCAGSISFDLPIASVLPQQAGHLAFIKENASTALCTA